MAGIRYCESCGAILQDGYRFCESCGAPVRVPASSLSGAPAGYGAYTAPPDNAGIDVFAGGMARERGDVSGAAQHGYGNFPNFDGGEYDYGGYSSGVPGRVTGENNAFTGPVPPPLHSDGRFVPEEPGTEKYQNASDKYGGGMYGDRRYDDSRYDAASANPKIKSTMGASPKERGKSMSDEVKPYFREGGDL